MKIENLHPKFRELLSIPGTNEGLVQVGEDLEGKNAKYEIHNEVPIILDYSVLPEHIQSQIKYFGDEFSKNNKYKLAAWQQSYVDKFIKNFPDIKDKLIIDCGAGAGYMTIELAKLGAFVVATDLTVESLVNINNAAKEEGVADRVFAVCCNTEILPFKSGVFDFYISNAVLEHLPNEKSAIEEIARVCKDDAGVMVTVPILMRFTNPIFLGLNIYNDKKVGHLRRYDENVLQEKFGPFGFNIFRNYYTGHFMKVIFTIVNLLFKTDRWDKLSEQIDTNFVNNKWGSNNIISFFKRN